MFVIVCALKHILCIQRVHLCLIQRAISRMCMDIQETEDMMSAADDRKDEMAKVRIDEDQATTSNRSG